MGMSKKMIAIAVTAIMVVSGVSVYYLFGNSSFFNKKGSDSNSENYSDIGDLYFDIQGADEIGICTVGTGSDSLSNASIIGTISVSMMSVDAVGDPVNDNNNNRPMNHDNYLVAPSRVHSQLKDVQNKLFIDDEHGNRKIVKAYLNNSDMNNNENEINYKQNIVYVADAGKFILITYYNHSLSEVYDHLNYHGAFWSADRDYSTALVEKSSGKIHTLSGLWCGCTYARYSGTNEIMPSIEYAGQINGESAFLINLHRNLSINNDNTGMFHDKRGLVSISIEDGQVTYKELITEHNAGIGIEYDDKGERITVYDEGSPFLGSEFDFYKNGIVHYYELYGVISTNNHSGPTDPIVVKHYLWFSETDEKIEVDWYSVKDVDGYLCTSATYSNDYFPTTCVRYKSDGSTETVMFTAEDSYRIASEQTYDKCFYREKTGSQTKLCMMFRDESAAEIKKITLNSNGTYTQDDDIFGGQLTAQYVTVGFLGQDSIQQNMNALIEYDNRLFYKFDIRDHNTYHATQMMSNIYIGLIIYNDCLYKIVDNNLEVYNLTTGVKTVKNFTEIDKLLYMYVDGDDHFIIEGSSGDGYLRGTMKDDGSFKFKKADLELDVVKKVKTS